MKYSRHCQMHVTPNHFLPLAGPFPWHSLQSFYSSSMGIIRIICLILLQNNNKSLQNTERGTFGKTHEQLTLWWWHINIEQYAWWPKFWFCFIYSTNFGGTMVVFRLSHFNLTIAIIWKLIQYRYHFLIERRERQHRCI